MATEKLWGKENGSKRGLKDREKNIELGRKQWQNGNQILNQCRVIM